MYAGSGSLSGRRDSVLTVNRPTLVTELEIRDLERRRDGLPVARFGRGYDAGQVDAFLVCIMAAIRDHSAANERIRAGGTAGHGWWGGERADDRPTSLDVEEQVFEMARRGYRMREVDELLDEVADLLARLEAETVALRAAKRSG